MAAENSKNEKNEKDEKDEKDEKKKSSKPTPFTEWLIALLGLILVAGAVGTTFYRAVSQERTPPRFEISAEAPERSGDGYLVRFSIVNGGNQTAAAVAVEGELKKDAETLETASATLTYAPANSTRRGGLYFTKNPQEYELNIRVVGYEEP